MSPSRVVTGESPINRLGIRTAPVQERSSARLDSILEAAAELSDELRWDDITTALIARRAGVSIGTVYRFFSDKPAVYRALAIRHFEAYVTRLHTESELRLADTAGDLVTTVRDLVDLTVDLYVDMLRNVHGFRGFGDTLDRHLLDTELGDGDGDRDNDTVLADSLLDILGRHAGIKGTNKLRLALVVAVSTSDALLALAFRRDPEGDNAVIAETKTVVSGYLDVLFSTPRPRSRR